MLGKACLALFAALFWVFLPLAAMAAVTDVDVLPTRKSLPLNTTSSVTLTWTVTWTTNGTNASSPRLIFRVNGSEVGEFVSLLNSTTSPESFTEIVSVPQDLLRLAAESPSGVLEAVRIFSQGLSTQQAVVQIRPVGRLSGDPRIEQMLLRFTDLSRYKMVLPGESAQAFAELRLGNVTRLRGVWEVADPMTSQLADPVYRVIETVNQTLTGKSQVNIFSPALPQTISGPYLVRFRIIEPAAVVVVPPITYYVSLSASGEIPAGDRIGLDEPGDGMRLSDTTSFAWQSVAGVKTFRLEIFEAVSLVGREASQQPQEQPLTPGNLVAGVLVPGNKMTTRLSPATLARLSPGETYVWRIVALDADDQEIAASPTRRMTYLP